jgi:hypothetical protein
MWHTHTYTIKYYSVLKRKDILTFATTWRKLKDIMLNKPATKTMILLKW